MIREAENKVRIEGLLSEINIGDKSYLNKVTGEMTPAIGGWIKVQVNQNINGEEVTLEIPVHLFANKYTKKNTDNLAYKNIEEIKDKWTSIAAAGGTQNADAVRITSGKIVMNEFSKTGELSSYPRIIASFVSKIKQEDMNPEATFSTTFVVGKKNAEVDNEGIETGRYKIVGVLPQYGDKVDVVEFITTNPRVIAAIDQYWNENDTVRAIGRLNFSSKKETVSKEVDFGESQEYTRTYSVSELIITGGSAAPLEGDYAYDINDIKEALNERTIRIEEMKEKATNTSKTRNAPITNSNGKIDLGF